MRREEPRLPPGGARKGVQAQMTAQLAVRQFLLLLVAATAMLFVAMFVNYYGATFWYVWERQVYIDFRWFSLPALIVLIYGYVLLTGLLFSLTPSEKSFSFFFASMMLALTVAHYDHSIVDWFLGLFGGAQFRVLNPVSAFKILFSGLFILVVVAMHYNILADDFARRMLRRGIPTDEVAPIRANMFKVLLPTVMTAGGIAFALAVVGEFGAFVFGQSGLFLPKLQLFLLAALIVPIAFVLRSILRDLAATRQTRPPAGPNP